MRDRLQPNSIGELPMQSGPAPYSEADARTQQGCQASYAPGVVYVGRPPIIAAPPLWPVDTDEQADGMP